MTYRLVALDLDGTLFNSNHQVTAANAAAVRECVARGVRVVLASGRMFYSMQPVCVDLGLDGPHISQNGAITTNQQGDVFHTAPPLGWKNIAAAVDVFEAHDIVTVVYGANNVYTTTEGPHIDVIRHFGEPEAVIVPSYTSAYVEHPVKVIGFVDTNQYDAELAEQINPYMATIRTGPLFFEGMLPGISKGNALATIANGLDIAANEILAIGDSYNDVSMFNVAGMSIAMGGADEAIQRQARDVTTGCNDDGVAAALRKYVLN